MKRKFLWMVLITQALAIIVLVFRPTLFFSESLSTVAETSKSVSPKEAAEPKEKEDSERPTSMTLQMHISLAAQKASDIRVERLSVAEASFETAAWGVVLPTSGLTEARMKLDQVQQELTQMSLLVDRAQQEFDRQSTLWRDGANVAKKTVDQAKHDLDEAEQKRKAARSARETLRDTVRAEWGNDVLNALEDGKGGGLASVLSGQSRLLLIAEGHSVEATVALAEHPEVKMKALRLGPAPQAEPGTGHATWFWLAPAEQLRTGQRVRLISGSIKQASKVRIPESAVVWQAGQSWIFIQTDTEQFERKAVRLGLPVHGGWQLEGEIPVGTAVVTQGAQLMLSEESRTQIRNENGD